MARPDANAGGGSLLDRIIGQAAAVRAVRNRAAGRSAAHAYLFHGEAHLGKETLARAFSMAMNCPTRDACGDCPACRQIARGVYPFHAECRRAWDEIPVDELRARVKPLSLTAPAGVTKFLLVNDAGNLNAASSNMLLKTLEEPPPATILVLVAERAESLLPTIRSRCEPVSFTRADRAALAAALPPDLPGAEALVEAADGRPGLLRILAERGVAAEELEGADLLGLADRAYEPPDDVAEVAALGPAGFDWDPLERRLLARTLVKARLTAAFLAAAERADLFHALAAASCLNARQEAFFGECGGLVDALLRARAECLDPEALRALKEEAERRLPEFRAREIHDIIQLSVRHYRNACVGAADAAAARRASRALEALAELRDVHLRDNVRGDGLFEAIVTALRRRLEERPR